MMWLSIDLQINRNSYNSEQSLDSGRTTDYHITLTNIIYVILLIFFVYFLTTVNMIMMGVL